MAQRLSRSGSIVPHSGRTSKHEVIDVLNVGAMRIAGKAIANFNSTACSMDYDYLEGDEDEFVEENEDENDENEEEVSQFFAPDHVGDG